MLNILSVIAFIASVGGSMLSGIISQAKMNKKIEDEVAHEVAKWGRFFINSD